MPSAKELTIHRNYGDDLPVITSDREKLTYILQNLISNAIKFTDKSSVSISALQIPESGEMEFKVADTRTGISKDPLPVIFDMFRQIDNSETRPYRGVGLGLFIVKKFTEMLGGKIEVESKPGTGSVFTIKLPCEPHKQ